METSRSEIEEDSAPPTPLVSGSGSPIDACLLQEVAGAPPYSGHQLRQSRKLSTVLASIPRLSTFFAPLHTGSRLRQVSMIWDIGLLTFLSIVMLGPDHTFGEHLDYGFP